MTTTTPDLQYPIGRFTHVLSATDAMRRTAIDEIAALPARMRAAVAGLTDAQLDTPYRPGGWTVRQVVHHVPDSHVNAYIRLKLALTEDQPTIKPYDEKTWATLADTRLPVEVSLTLLDSIHARWVAVCRDLKPSDWARTFIHPEYPEGPRTIDWLVQVYAWHSNHHVAHITSLRRREDW
jgi:DinB superfamily